VIDPPTIKDLGLAGFVVFILIDRLFTWLGRYKLVGPNGKEKDTHVTTTAGGKSTEFWILTFKQIIGEIVKDAMVTATQMMIRMERNQIEMKQNHLEILKLLQKIRSDQRIKRDSDEL